MLESCHLVKNKCNRVKGWHWRWLIYALHNFLLCNILHVFRSNHDYFLKFLKFCRKTPVLESLFSLKWQNYINPYFCQDWHHNCAKNTVDLFILQKILLWILGKWFMKALKKVIHFTTNISMYTGHRHFEVIMLIFLCICIKHSQH